MESAEGILQAVNGREVVSHSGGALAGLPAPQGDSLAPTTLMAMLFIFLVMMMLFSMRQPRADRGPEKPNGAERRGPEPPVGGAH